MEIRYYITTYARVTPDVAPPPIQSQRGMMRQGPPALVLLFGLLVMPVTTPIHASAQVNETRIQIPDDHEDLLHELSALESEIQERARSVSIDEAVAQGIRANPQLQEAFAAIQQFEWQLIAVQRQWYPSLLLTNGTPFAGVQWETFSQRFSESSSTTASSFSNVTRLDVFQPGATISWNFLDPTRQPNINAATETLRQQKLLFDVSSRNLILNIQENYYAVQSSRQLIANFRRIFEINKRQLSMLEAQQSIGMTTVLDVETTRSQLFNQLNQLVGYTRDYIQQTAALAASMALPEGVLAIPSEEPSLGGVWEHSLEQTIKKARRQREEILASLAAAEAARWTGLSAIRSYLPVLGLVVNGNLVANRGPSTFQTGGVGSTATSSLSNVTASVGLGFSWTLFDGGIQAANAQVANAQALQQKAQAATTELLVMQQVRASYGQLLTAKVAYTTALSAYRSAEVAQRASRARFAVGVGDITSVVQTIQQLSQAAEQLSSATFSYNTALVQLYRFSSTWPAQTEPEVEERLRQLRKTPASAVKSILGP